MNPDWSTLKILYRKKNPFKLLSYLSVVVVVVVGREMTLNGNRRLPGSMEAR